MQIKNSTNEVRIVTTMDKYGDDYFITIRKHQVKDYVDVQEIMEIISYLMGRLSSLRLGSNAFEIDKRYNQLHFHVIVSVNEYFKFKGISSIRGFRVYWKKIYNHKGLIRYLYKDSPNKYKQEEIINTNYYTHNKAPNRFIN